jgi:hypothetical protein
MIGIITGDIVNSRSVSSEIWLPELKTYFGSLGKHPEDWEIYRGDSFQIQVKPQVILEKALIIKLLIQKNKNINVRMSLGIGELSFKGERITESNGSAFIYSGENLDKLKGTQIVIETPFDEINEYFNPILQLIDLISLNWKSATAETMYLALTNENSIQKELSQMLSKAPATINKALKRGGFSEIKEILALFDSKIKKYV